MRKTNHVRHEIWLAIAVFLLVSGCPSRSGVEGNEWFRCASEFDEARNALYANDAARSGTAADDLARINRLQHKFLSAKQPTETEIVFVLKSPDRRLQKVGLAAMCLRPIETDQMVDILFGYLRDKDFYFRTDALYALDKFTQFPESRKSELGRQLLEIVKTREGDLSAQEILLLGRFPSEESAQFLIGQLMKEGKDNRIIRYSAFEALKKMGDLYYDKAAEYVNVHGSPEAKKELPDLEKSWERRS
jgi:HEAT repeat protein